MEREADEDQETLMNSLGSMHEGILVSEITGCTGNRRHITKGTWHGRYEGRKVVFLSLPHLCDKVVNQHNAPSSNRRET